MPQDRDAPNTELRQHTVSMSLSDVEVRVLEQIAHFHEKSLGPTRWFVRLTAPADVKEKYRFIVQEGKWLERFAASTRGKLVDSENDETVAEFTPRALVAFWGRLLASLNSPRARRKLKQHDIAVYERMAQRFEAVVSDERTRRDQVIDDEIGTRRLREQAWMIEALEGQISSVSET